jgi:hypothetical protein
MLPTICKGRSRSKEKIDAEKTQFSGIDSTLLSHYPTISMGLHRPRLIMPIEEVAQDYGLTVSPL